MTFETFKALLKPLSVLRFPPATLDAHYAACGDVPEATLTAARDRALKAQNDFPTPHELLTYADLTNRPAPVGAPEDRTTPLAQPVEWTIPETSQTIRVTHEWRFDCERCQDGGRVSYWCAPPSVALAKPWYHRRACERRGEHDAHEWVGPCPCADTNPTIQRRVAARARYAHEPATTRRAS